MSEENKTVASETASEQPTQETSTSSPDVGALIAESKKYRSRAQDAEARIAEMEKTLAKANEEKLKEKEEYKTLYEEASSKIDNLSANADKWDKYEDNRRALLLEIHPEEDRDQLKSLDLDTLEFVTNKIKNNKPNAPQVVGRTKDVVIDKRYVDMNDAERRVWFEQQMNSHKG